MTTLVKLISGATGVPVHFLGFPELLSNRDTADNLVELIALSTNKERRIWVQAYTDALRIAMGLYNDNFQNNLNPDAVVVKIPFVSKVQMDEVKNVWLPLYTEGTVTLKTLLSQLSGEVDVEAEVIEVEKLQAEKQAREDANAKLLLESRNTGNGASGASGNGRPGATATNKTN